MQETRNDPGKWRAPLAIALAAIALRLLLFLGRGDYIAFDEGWYLLLGRSLWEGEGYRLSGLRHFTLSPLFPILAGGMAKVVGNPVWGGRIVAAITSGLLVLPAWSIFNRISGRRVAFLAAILIAVIPSLAPFAAPELVGWDLWVGAEPVFHLFLFMGLALVLRAWESGRPIDWAGAGAAFSLAYLARPEAVLMAGLVGVAAVAFLVARRSPKALIGPVLMGVAFAIVSFPYWYYLHDVTGRWSLTGRSVQVVKPSGGGGRSSSEIIEGMLWQGSHDDYTRHLFRLHPTGTRMASTYWGMPEPEEDIPSRRSEKAAAEASAGSALAALEGAGAHPAGHEPPETEGDEADRAAPQPGRQVGDRPGSAVAGAEDQEGSAAAAARTMGPRSRVALYLEALGRIIPLWLSPLILIGMIARRSRPRAEELLVAAPLLVSSILIAGVVAIDPRTQLFIVPLAAYYAARGILSLGDFLDERMSSQALQRGFIAGLLAVIVVGVFLTEDLRRAYVGSSSSTIRQVKAAADREMGEILRRRIPEDATITSWHPSIGLHSRRRWRVQPMGDLTEVVRYANAVGSDYMVISVAHPGPIPLDLIPGNFLVIQVPEEAAGATSWKLELSEVNEGWAVGSVRPE